jgi:hypothetical protein
MLEVDLEETVKKFIAYQEPLRFFHLTTRVRQWTLSWASSVELTHSLPISTNYILMLYFSYI